MKNTTEKDIYIADFYALTRNASFNNTLSLQITINTSSRTLTGDTLEGVYQGMSYAQLKGIYTRAKVYGGACGIYLVH